MTNTSSDNGLKPNSPKIVFLDQNAWIYLAQGHYGVNRAFSEVAKLAVNASEDERVIFPLYIGHFAETAKNKKMERRERLSQFMVKLSKGNTLLPSNIAIEREIECACLQAITGETIDLLPWLLGKGYAHMMGSSGVQVEWDGVVPKEIEKINKMLSDKMLDPKTFVALVNCGIDKQQLKELTDNADKTVTLVEDIRKRNAGIPKASRYKTEVVMYFDNSLLKRIVDFMLSKQLSPKLLDPVFSNKDSLIRFFRTMPSNYCLFELSYFRDMQPQRKIQSNDMNDLMSLCLAIPYCDVVVTERQWANGANQRGIDKEYKTLVLGSVTDLKSALSGIVGYH